MDTRVVEGFTYYKFGKQTKKLVKELNMSGTEEDFDKFFNSYPELEDEYTMYLDTFGAVKYRPSVTLRLSLKMQ